MDSPRLDPDSPAVIRAALMNIIQRWPPAIVVSRAQFDALITTYPGDAHWINRAVDSRILVISDG